MARQAPFRGRRPWQRGPRRNERIRSREVRVIGPKGDQIGIMATEKAIQLARQIGYDLVEISANANPPVCRILDFGKYMYEQSKKTKDSKATTSKIKEVKFRVKIGEHDYMTKLRHAEEFLGKGNKVKLTLTFRGREMEHKELGFENITRAIGDLNQVGVPDAPPRLAGRNINAMLSPLPANKRKIRWNEPEPEGAPARAPDHEPDDDHESGDDHESDGEEE
ncbi:MAG: translation initiation factor IF-3 [Opitutales bacterium]